MNKLRQRIVRNGIASFVLRISSIGLGLAGSIVLARTLGATEYGAYSLAISTMSLLAIPVNAGLPTLVFRETAAADANHDLSWMRGIWNWSARIALFSSAILFIGCAAIWLIEPTFISQTFALSILLVPLIAFGGIRSAALRGLQHILAAQLPESVVRPGLLALGVFAIGLVLDDRITAPDAMVVHAVAAMAGFAVGAGFLLKFRPKELASAPIDHSRNSTWLAAILPIALVSGMQVVNQNAGVVLVGFFQSHDQAALFRVALSASAIVPIGMQVVVLPFEPHFVRAHQTKDIAMLQKSATSSVASGFLATIPVAAIFWIGGRTLIGTLYGQTFADAATILNILVIWQMVRSYFGACETILVLTGHERINLNIWIVSTTLGLALATGLCLAIGTLGVAAAMLASTLLLKVWQWYAVRQRIGIDTALHSILARRISLTQPGENP